MWSACACAENIGRLEVLSLRGEPLRVVATVQPAPGERLTQDCLSLGDERDAPDPDYPLLRDARVILSAAGDRVEIVTDKPVAAPAVSLVLKVQCPGQPSQARLTNLLLPGSRHAAVVLPVEPAVPGFTIVLRPGESVASIARAIYPRNEAARTRLARAIARVNPDLFPAGKLRSLPAGTALRIPDLRAVKSVLALPPPGPSAEAPPAGRPAAPAPVRAAPATEERPRARAPAARLGVLRLKLSRGELDLRPSAEITEAKREELRQQYLGEGVAVLSSAAAQALELKIAQLRESQGVINDQLAKLEQAVETLRRSFAAQAAAPPPVAPAPPVAAAPPIATPAGISWLQWAILAAAAVLLTAIAFVAGRRGRLKRAMDNHEARIEALLAEAREAAGPLLSTEAPPPPRPPPAARREVPPPPAPAAAPAEPPRPAAEARAESTSFDQTQRFATATQPTATAGVDVVLEAEAAAQAEAVRTDLRREMDLALDSSRSMFTDVDRFIALGRIQNAISLLEFQIHKDPSDRDSWVKLMAVYRQEGMETEFQRTYEGFKRRFPQDAY
ncbi:MAG TPA: hypothetical protein VFB20_12065 [Burkholderiales bacterium]|nr:hypothetical protein [Burkholderiales bacterium]